MQGDQFPAQIRLMWGEANLIGVFRRAEWGNDPVGRKNPWVFTQPGSFAAAATVDTEWQVSANSGHSPVLYERLPSADSRDSRGQCVELLYCAQELPGRLG